MDQKLNKKIVNDIQHVTSKMSSHEINQIIEKKIEQLKNESNVNVEKVRELQIELAILIANQPINLEKTQKYWKELILNGKK